MYLYEDIKKIRDEQDIKRLKLWKKQLKKILNSLENKSKEEFKKEYSSYKGNIEDTKKAIKLINLYLRELKLLNEK